MRSRKRNIAVLTSSRADYGIYLPLLKKLKDDSRFSLKLIVFGTHHSPYHGMTIEDIKKDGFDIDYTLNSMLLHDDENAIATAVSLTMLKFSDFWSEHKDKFDLVFCLGDRYEMFAAVYAGIPFNMQFAHIHGGETTLGAIDNTYRHAISLASDIHFTSHLEYADKVSQLTGSTKIFTTGALSLENLNELTLYSLEEMKEQFTIDFSIPSILITVHPETVNSDLNSQFGQECFAAFEDIADSYQLVITMPNADTEGTIFRKIFNKLKVINQDKILLIENFGTRGYFSAMKLAKFLIGNTSSGIIEAASFGKYVINLGDRQKGRVRSENVIEVPFRKDSILMAVNELKNDYEYSGSNVYSKKSSSDEIIDAILNEE
jgi:GDP/UDP-N,N'-diacetylbacillosamine 2-epimerase (hydrolysing)